MVHGRKFDNPEVRQPGSSTTMVFEIVELPGCRTTDDNYLVDNTHDLVYKLHKDVYYVPFIMAVLKMTLQ